MKELILNKEGLMLRQNSASTSELTTQARERYSKGGEIFMATEGQSNMPPNSQPTSPENAERSPLQKEPVSAERQAMTREAWDKAGEGKTRTFEERRIIDKMISMGRGPTIIGGADTSDIGGGKPPGEPPAPPVSPAGAGGESRDEFPVDNSMPDSIKRIAQEMNKEAERLGSKREFSREYLRQQISRIHRLIDEGKFSQEETSKVHNFISSLNKAIDEIEEKEASREKLILNEEDFKDLHIRSKIPGINSILEKIRLGKLSVEAYGKFRGQLSDLTSPKEYTSVQKQIFDVEKQQLRSLLSDVFINSLHPQSKDRVEKRTALTEAMGEKNYDEIERIIMEEMDIDDSNIYAPAIRDAILDTMKNKDVNQIKERDYTIEFLLEYAVERILGMADAKPKEAYPQFNLYQQMNLDAVLQAARKYDEMRNNPDDGMFRYLAELMSKRQIMHELFRSMKERKTYVEYVSNYLRKSGFAFVEKSVVGISDVQIIYEKILGSMKSSKKSWLTDIDFEQVDEEIKTYLKESNEKGNLQKNLMDKDNKITDRRKLRDWELKRAMFMGRSLSAASQRRITYGVLGEVPPDTDIDTLFKSLEFEFIARILAPIKILPQRFFGWTLGKWYIKTVIAEAKKGAEKESDGGRTFGYGKKEKDKDGNEHRKGLYGQSDDAFAVLDTGITDPKTNSWRGRWLFLKQKDYALYSFEGTKVSIGEYLDRLEAQFRDEVRKQGIIKKDSKINDEAKKLLNRYLSEGEGKKIIDQQRIFLGALLKGKDSSLDLKNRTELWKKAAHFLPSRMAAFFPEETMEIVNRSYGLGNNKDAIAVKWKEIQRKIWDAEYLRVKNDAEVLKRLKNESWDSVKDDLKGLDFNYEKVGIRETGEKLVIKELQDFGESHAEELAKIKFPFTPFLDDVPKTDWENLTDEDFDRILINDQSAFEEGYGAIIGLIAKPATTPDEAAKAFITAYDKIQFPLGQSDARKYLEKHIVTYLKMTNMNSWAKWFSWAMKLLRMPRSEIEKGNLQAEIAYDADSNTQFTKVLAQHTVLSDDPSETDAKGLTQYMRIKKENDADAMAKAKMFARLILMLLGPVMGAELLKIILPDLAKMTSR